MSHRSSLSELCWGLLNDPQLQAHRSRALEMWKNNGKCSGAAAISSWNKLWEREIWWQLTFFGMIADALCESGVPACCYLQHESFDREPLRFRWVCALVAPGVCIGSKGDVISEFMSAAPSNSALPAFRIRELDVVEPTGNGSLLDLFRQFPKVSSADQDFFKRVIQGISATIQSHLLNEQTPPVSLLANTMRL